MTDKKPGMGYRLGAAMFSPGDVATMTLEASCRVVEDRPESDTTVMAAFEASIGGVRTKFKVLIITVNLGYLSSPRYFPVRLLHWPDGLSINEVQLGPHFAPEANRDGWVHCRGLDNS